ncbi:hypothetical protein [Halobacterium hubeiense]|uniref:COG4315 family predicted lipoprotein n=1 Tax=Halobacterium hubeiense TaxID=1407499 RepID=UPI003C763FF8
MYRRLLLTALGAGAAAAVAGCTGGDAGDETNQGEETREADATYTVAVGSTDDYGPVLVDADGSSLYVFDEDTPGESSCYEGCAGTWPPLTVDEDPSAGPDVTAELGTTDRDDGSAQVTADERPLYYYAGDDGPGDTAGQGVGDVWWLVAPDGSKIRESTTEESLY